MTPGDLDDETARVLREAIITEALSDSPSPFVLGRMIDTYGSVGYREGAQESLRVAGESPDSEPVDDEPDGQPDWRDIDPPDEVIFEVGEKPHGTDIVINHIIAQHKNMFDPNWAVYMGLLDRLPDVPGEDVTGQDLLSAADPWPEEDAIATLEDLSTPVEGCFAVNRTGGHTSVHDDMFAITEVGQAIDEWWKGKKYDQLKN